MKKNISINISGIIFHIEDDGYELLRQYLDSINNYFGSFKDSSEILADIESRVAEIFLGKLNDGKQVITLDDVQSLIATMGSVNDFKAAEEQENGSKEQAYTTNESTFKNQSSASQPHKRLYRDQKRKIIGGIGAGLGHYFNVDPVWPRLLLALLVLGSYGGLLLLYIILWIVLPASDELVEEQPVKKMFRNSGNKVLGGVAGGVAAFFGADLVLVRILFVLSIFLGGLGILVYFILWFSLPEAKTITEKMQMQGEPVTLSNIETSVKKSLNEKDGQEESTLAKIVLFPFRVIAAIINGLTKAITPLAKLIIDIFRIAFGICISIIGFLLILSTVLATGVFFGYIHNSNLPDGWTILSFDHVGLPMDAIRQSFPTITFICIGIAALIPALFIMLLGNSILAKRFTFKPYVGWALFVLFFLSVAFLSINIPGIIYGFKEEAEFKVEKTFAINNKIQVFKLHEVELDDYRVTQINLKGYDGKEIRLVQRFESQGATKILAKENAQMVDYTVTQADSVLTFDSNITFKKDAKFRFQRLNMELFIPYGQPFEVDGELWEIIQNNPPYYNIDLNRQTYQWRFTKEERLECLTCPAKSDKPDGIAATDEFGLKDFKEIELKGVFDVIIHKGDEYSIAINGNDEQQKLYDVNQYGDKLEIYYRTKRNKFWNRTFAQKEFVTLEITLPSLEKLEVTGAGKMSIKGFEENEMHIELTGAMSGEANLLVDQLHYTSSGPIAFELNGHGDYLEASLSGPSQLKADDFKLSRASITAHGLAQVSVNPTETLEIDKDFTSNVKYNGNPEVIKKD
jgi:phage shock protein PspC (stress-responsive transcriptional regulator)